MERELADYLNSETATLLDFIYDGVYIVDRDRNIALWNHGAERITGHLAADVQGRCCKDNILNHIDSEGTLLCEGLCPLQKALDTGATCEAKVYPLHRDGHRIPVEVHIGPVWGRDGQVIGAIEVFRDVSADERLRAVEAKFRQVIHRYVSESTYQEASALCSDDTMSESSTRDLTVLFVDIVGFTSLTERLGPSRTVDLLNGFFTAAAKGVRLHTGEIDKFIGDCALALFSDPEDAVSAAEDFLNQGLPLLNQSLSERGLPGLAVRIGINSGPVVQGTIGTEERRDLTVIGDVVNTASRVQGASPVNGYLITESTKARLAHQERFALVDEVLLKGKSAPVKVYHRR